MKEKWKPDMEVNTNFGVAARFHLPEEDSSPDETKHDIK